MHRDAIAQLKALDLTTYPKNEIHTLIRQFGKFGAVAMDLHPGKVLIRARPNEAGKTFSLRSDLSYKPPKYNTTYQRASTPDQTMFYAGTIPENIRIDELDNARLIATLEASHLLRDNIPDGEQLITFSKWVVVKDIRLFAVCYHRDFTENSSHTHELYNAYHAWTKTLSDELREKSIEVTEFMANEFAKMPIRGDFDYMISAIFTEIMARGKTDGVYFPSVRAGAQGYNVAIVPEVADSCLKLVAAGECTIYKKGAETFVDNETVCLIKDDTSPFKLVPVDPAFHEGRDKILNAR
ncbi:MAG: hypothetical protein BGO55_08280 [Sphingobacteriales bacterium 50-39]|nr:hypothetical protein [Sphingobacteriales bacterium]OJW59259.1 MAG: hypothetical protein BGO55_08280 [Sphingobacteriales bacterium 50-39]